MGSDLHSPFLEMTEKMPGFLKNPGVQALFVVCLACAVYAGTLNNGLVWDDPGLLGYINQVVSQKGPAGLLTSEFLLETGPTNQLGYYRPVILVSLALDKYASASVPAMFHLTNMILHAANSLLLYAILRCLFSGPLTALAGAALFAVHPVHVEAVAFVAGRTDLWACLFILATTLVWLRKRSKEVKILWPLLSGLFYLFGILSKEVAFLLPAALFAWDGLESGFAALKPAQWWRRNGRWLTVWTAALFVGLLLRMTLADIGFGSSGGGLESKMNDLIGGLSYIPGRIALYLRLMLAPWPLNAWYTPEQVSLSLANVIFAAGVLTIFLSAAGKRYSRNGLATLAWFFIFFVPASGLVPLWGAFAAERFIYISSVGFCVAVAAVTDRLGRSGNWNRIMLPALVIALLLGSAGTIARSEVWKDETTLFTSLIATSPNSGMGQYNLGRLQLNAGQNQKAAELLAVATRHKPDYPLAFNNLGVAYSRLGRHQEAVQAYLDALKLDGRNVGTWYNLAIEYSTLKNRAGAVMAYGKVIELQPGNTDARFKLALAYLAGGNKEGARQQYEVLSKADPVRANMLRRYLGLSR